MHPGCISSTENGGKSTREGTIRGVDRRERTKRGSGMKDRDETCRVERNGDPHGRDLTQNRVDRTLQIIQSIIPKKTKGIRFLR